MQSVCTAELRDLPALKGNFRRLSDNIRDLDEAIKDSNADRLSAAIIQASEWLVPAGMLVTYDHKEMSMEQLKAGARSDKASLMNAVLANAKLVIWAKANGSSPAVPAIFCPDDVTAFFALQVTQRTRLCRNPKCRMPFVASAGKFYHHERCGVAHRTQRWRRAKAKREQLTVR